MWCFAEGGGTHGENLAYFEPAGMYNYVEATRLWVDEKKNYHGRILTQGSGEKNRRRISSGVITLLSYGRKLGGFRMVSFAVLEDKV
jgi:hypothetical protein